MKEKFHALAHRTAISAVIAVGALLGVATPQAYAHYCGSDTASCNGCLAGSVCKYGSDCQSCCESSCTLDNCGGDSICTSHCRNECYNWCSGTTC